MIRTRKDKRRKLQTRRLGISVLVVDKIAPAFIANPIIEAALTSWEAEEGEERRW